MSAITDHDRANAFKAIHRSDCAAAIWQRQLPSDLFSWIENLDPNDLPSGRASIEQSEIRDVIKELCEDLMDLDETRANQLIDDAAQLAENFATTMDAPYVRVRMSVVTSNSCRKFHKDAIKARLVCTYRGTGTQYGISAAGEDPKAIATIEGASPIILRGSLWPEAPDSGLLHRSPPIAGTGETRLLFVVDVIDDPETEL